MYFKNNIELFIVLDYNNTMKRVILLVIDSFGIGKAADADKYGDEGSNTYAAVINKTYLPTLRSLGLDNIVDIDCKGVEKPLGSFARLSEKSAGKDTTTGHFELAGLIVDKPFPTYPNGFPDRIVNKLKDAFGIELLGNEVASGTEIINRLGDEHLKTRKPILYTSADSVLQIACHESIYPPEKLYQMCLQARRIMTGEDGVSRIIARPFVGDKGVYKRTDNRKDFSLPPFGQTMLDVLKQNNKQVASVGKISDIFCGKGITDTFDAHDNLQSFRGVLNALQSIDNGLIFANFVDTDMLYGHRNDIAGYANCLNQFDKYLADILLKIKDEDVLIVTADHGCDPSTLSTDHSRENVPLLIFSQVLPSIDLGEIEGFDVVADFVIDYLLDTKSGVLAKKLLK